MSRWAWIAIAALGCSSRSGLAIDVDLGGAASAELLAPVKPCSSCAEGIAPPGAQVPLVGRSGSGDVTFLDSPTRVLAPADANGHAHFELQAGTTDPIPKLVIVGFDANDAATGTYVELDDVNVPRQDGVVWNVKLQHPPAGTQLIAWRQPAMPCGSSPTHASCVGIEDTSDSSTAFYVPGDDADCDGCTGSADCNHFWYLDTETDAPCFTDRQVGAGSGEACEAGVGTCTDGEGTDQMTCKPIADLVCVPGAVCGNGPCFGGVASCVQPAPLPLGDVVLQCTLVASIADGGNGELDATPCDTSLTIASVVLPAQQCLGAELAAPGAAVVPLPTTMSVVLTSPMLDAQQSDATISVAASVSSGCVVVFGWSGTLVFQSQNMPVLDAQDVVVDLGGMNQLVVPLSLVLDTGDCTTGVPSIECELVGTTDTLWSCAGP